MGEDIWIAEDEYGNNKVLWNNGKLYNKDRTEYKGSNSFVLQTANALDKINEHEQSSDVLNKYVKQDYDITIIQGNSTYSDVQTAYSELMGTIVSKYQTIKFNPTEGLYQCKNYDDKGASLAPFVALFHEFGHIDAAITNFESYDNRLKSGDPTYSNLEEKHCIQKYEWPLAKHFNMLQRDSHIIGTNGLEYFESVNSTSIQRKNK